jgi:branched-chain amino acid transport system substrate-binding protein
MEPETFSVTGYDAYMILVDAIERAGSTDPVAIKDALLVTKFVGARGEMVFDEERNGLLGVPVIIVKDGKKTFAYIATP